MPPATPQPTSGLTQSVSDEPPSRPRMKRFTGWLPPDWYDRLAAVADREVRTVDQQVSYFVREALARLDPAPGVPGGASPTSEDATGA